MITLNRSESDVFLCCEENRELLLQKNKFYCFWLPRILFKCVKLSNKVVLFLKYGKFSISCFIIFLLEVLCHFSTGKKVEIWKKGCSI